jgi:hypothetical protein
VATSSHSDRGRFELSEGHSFEGFSASKAPSSQFLSWPGRECPVCSRLRPRPADRRGVAVLRTTDTLLTHDVCRIAPGLGVPARPAWGAVSEMSPETRPRSFPRSAPLRQFGDAAAIVTHRMVDRLMDKRFLPQDRPDRGAGLIAILLLSLCLWPVVWELASAIRQYL